MYSILGEFAKLVVTPSSSLVYILGTTKSKSCDINGATTLAANGSADISFVPLKIVLRLLEESEAS